MVLKIEQQVPGVASYIDKMSERYSFGVVESQDLRQEGWLAVFSIQDRLLNMNLDDRAAYAAPFIRRSIIDYSLANRRIVKMISTKEERKVLSAICREKLNAISIMSSDIKRISDKIKISVDSVDLAFRFLGSDISIGVSAVETDSFLNGYDEFDLVSNLTNTTTDKHHKLEAVFSALNCLSDCEREVVTRRWLGDNKETLRSISESLHLSISGVAFIEANAIAKVKSNFGI